MGADETGNRTAQEGGAVSTVDTSTRRRPSRLIHRALVYRSLGELETRMREFVTEAEARSEPTLVVLPPARLELVRRLRDDVRVELHLRDATLVARNPSVVLELLEGWVSAHSGPVRAISELIWPGRRPAEVVECLRHEALVAEQLRDARLSLLCAFDGESLAGEALEGLRLTHPALMSGDGGSEPSETYREPDELLSNGLWPQEPPAEPVVEVPFGEDLHELRRRVAEQEIVEALPAAQRDNLVFAVNEAVTNSIKYADGRCRVRLWHDGAAVVAEVRSRSRLRDRAAGRRRPSPRAAGGRGLWLVNHMCDLVELRCDGQETWVRLHVLDAAHRFPASAAGTSAA